MPSVFQLVYISDATSPMSNNDLEGLVKQCQHRNGKDNITGLLLYSGGHFIQLLEGRETEVVQLFTHISKDKRHHNVQELHLGKCAARLFPEWKMGLLNLDTICDLDRARLKKLIDNMTLPNGRKVLNLIREFRDQLPIQSRSAAA